MLSCCHVVMLSCCHVVMLSCCHVVLSCLVVMLSCWLVVLLSCDNFVMLSTCHVVLLSSCFMFNVFRYSKEGRNGYDPTIGSKGNSFIKIKIWNLSLFLSSFFLFKTD